MYGDDDDDDDDDGDDATLLHSMATSNTLCLMYVTMFFALKNA